MAGSARVAMPTVAIRDRALASVSAVPWYVWSAVVAVTSTTIGLYWDISWHTSKIKTAQDVLDKEFLEDIMV